MSALICGSLAFDTIMSFEGKFAQQILPEQLHILNVSFLVPSLRRDFGGCAGNIAYSLQLLGGTPLTMATLGDDGAAYIERLKSQGMETRYVKQLNGTFTAQAMIMTDTDNNQITAFHPGAMMQAHVNVIDGSEGAAIAIVSPDGRDAMLQHAAQEQQVGGFVIQQRREEQVQPQGDRRCAEMPRVPAFGGIGLQASRGIDAEPIEIQAGHRRVFHRGCGGAQRDAFDVPVEPETGAVGCLQRVEE